MGRSLSLLSLACVLAASPAALAAEPGKDAAAAKMADCRKLLEVTGAGNLGMQLLDQMIATFRQAAPKVPASFWDAFRKEVDVNELVDIVAAVYERHFTHDEIKELIKLYQTPIGKKLVQKQPLIAQESGAAGEVWGKQVSLRAVEKLAEQKNK